MTMPVVGCSRICAPQPACSPAWNRSRRRKPRRLEHADDAREEPPRAAEGVVVVVRPAEAEPVLPRLLDPGGPVARLPVVALGLEDEVARQVGPAGQLDDAGEQSPRSRRTPRRRRRTGAAAPARARARPGRRGPRAAPCAPGGPARRGTDRTPDSRAVRPPRSSSARRRPGRSDTGRADSRGFPGPGRAPSRTRRPTRP